MGTHARAQTHGHDMGLCFEAQSLELGVGTSSPAQAALRVSAPGSVIHTLAGAPGARFRKLHKRATKPSRSILALFENGESMSRLKCRRQKILKTGNCYGTRCRSGHYASLADQLRVGRRWIEDFSQESIYGEVPRAPAAHQLNKERTHPRSKATISEPSYLPGF